MSETIIRRDVIDGVRVPRWEARETTFWDEHVYAPLLAWSRTALATFREWPGRPGCGHFYGGSYWYGLETAQTVYALAVLARCGPFGAAVAGASRDELIAKTVAAIRYLGFTHDTGPADCVRAEGPNPHASLRKWGGAGDDFFRASQHGVPVAGVCSAAWLLWEHLDDETRRLAVNVLESYADRWAPEPPRSGVYLDTQTEENGWTGQCLGLAAAMLPHHSRAPEWSEAAARWMANIAVTPYDRSANTTPLQGKRVIEWASTVTTHPDFTAENHGFVHPNYMASGIHFAGFTTLYCALAGQPVPEVVRLNRQPLYDVLKWWTEADGNQTPVQGQDWYYTNHYGALFIHALMSVLFGDAEAAYWERRCAETASAIARSVGGGHFYDPDPEALRLNQFQSMRTAERGAAVSLAKTYLLHQLLGDGAEPETPAAPPAKKGAVRVFPHGGVVVRRGGSTFASFSWRNRPVVLVQPAEGAWAITPHPFSLSGSFVLDAPTAEGIREGGHRVDEIPGGFAATAAFERAGGALRQHVALVAPADDVAFFFQQTVAARDVRVVEERAGEVSVRNEHYRLLGDCARGRRRIYAGDDQWGSRARSFEAPGYAGGSDDWFRPGRASSWVNVDDRIGYVVLGGRGIAYRNRHEYPTYKGLEDFLILSHDRRAREFCAGQTVSTLAVVILPNWGHNATRGIALITRRLRTQTDADGVLAPGWLVAVNFAGKPRLLRLRCPIGPVDSVPAFAAQLIILGGKAIYEVPVGPRQAVALPSLAHVPAHDGVQAWGTPTGEVFLGEGSSGVRRIR